LDAVIKSARAATFLIEFDGNKSSNASAGALSVCLQAHV
jgi:hypothetical protein